MLQLSVFILALCWWLLCCIAVCDDCNQEWDGDCAVHGPLTVVEDTKVSNSSLSFSAQSAHLCHTETSSSMI
jgi:hypothetical protein